MSGENNNSGGFANLLVSAWKIDVLKELVRRPDYEFTIHELAGETQGAYGSVRGFVHELAAFDVVKRRKKGNSVLVQYRANNRYNAAILALLRTETQRLRRIAQEFADTVYEQNENDIESVILFGSVAKGTADKDSDIDILIVPVPDVRMGEPRVEQVEKKCRTMAETFQQEHSVGISVIVEPVHELRNKLVHGKRFEQEVLQWGETLAGKVLSPETLIQRREEVQS